MDRSQVCYLMSLVTSIKLTLVSTHTEHFHHPRKIPHALPGKYPTAPIATPPETIILIYYTRDQFAYSRVSYKWMHSFESGFSHLVSF